MELFGTAGIRGDVRERVTPDLALAVGRAAGLEAAEGGPEDERPAFVLGRDGRVTGPALAAAVEAGLSSAGADVRRVGQVPTPALAFASRSRRGIMLTASHNPPTDNGIKLFVDGVEYGEAAETRIENRVAAEDPPAEWQEWGTAGRETVLPAYREAVTEYARGFGADPTGLRVVVDCGNGMASAGTPQVLRALGAGVVTLNANVDGHFPGRESKPTPESLSDLRAFVADDDADLAFAHDGDADRVVVVDGDGEVVHEDTVLAILAERYVRASDAAEPVVVTTPNASARIDERVEAAGGRVERERLGYLQDGIDAVRKAGGDVVFAAEPWKHIHPGLGGWIDGVASAAVFARLVAEEGLDALRSPVTERPYEKVSIGCPDDRKEAVMARLEGSLPKEFADAEVDTEHGVRLTLPDGSWLLVRPSGTEPYVRLYAESENVEELIKRGRSVVESALDADGNG